VAISFGVVVAGGDVVVIIIESCACRHSFIHCRDWMLWMICQLISSKSTGVCIVIVVAV